MNLKQLAAEAAMEFIASDQVVGLGTGSTADYFLAALAREIGRGKLRGIRGVPTSRQSEARATELGIPLATLKECPLCDVTVDGADEVGPGLDLIKGLGGALLREKVVEQNTRRLVIIADEGKRVGVLGSKSPLPVEVTMFGHEVQEEFFRSMGCVPTLRKTSDGRPFVTDNGNLIYDCKFDRIDRPGDLHIRLKQRAGVVETGLFIGMAEIALIAGADGVERILRPR